MPAVTPASSTTTAMGPGAGVNAARFALAAVVCYLLYEIILPLIHVPLRGLTLEERWFLLAVPTALFMLLQLWLAQSAVNLGPSPRQSALGAVLCILLFSTTFYQQYIFRHLHIHRSAVLWVSTRAFYDMVLSLGLFFLGMLLSRIVRERNMLLPVAIIAMPIDYIGAMTSVGFTNTVEHHAARVVNAVSISVPSVGGISPIAFIGPGDALFMAFFFCVVRRLQINVAGTFWWMFGLLTLAMLAVFVTGIPIAALVPMGLAVVIPNIRYFTLKRDEVFAMIYAAVVVLAVVLGFYYVSHRMMTGG